MSLKTQHINSCNPTAMRNEYLNQMYTLMQNKIKLAQMMFQICGAPSEKTDIPTQAPD